VRIAIVLFLFALASCGGTKPVDPCLTAPTYTNQIRPMIIEAKCLGCHSTALVGMARNGAPEGFDFDTYELSLPHLNELASAITSGREPPPTLMPKIEVTPEERDLVRDWRACSYPK
jgi:uncharacterized membrane protein